MEGRLGDGKVGWAAGRQRAGGRAPGERAMGAIGKRGPHKQHVLRSGKRKIKSQPSDRRPEQLLKTESGEWWDSERVER